MTKVDWKKILEELKTMRSTNKFDAGIKYVGNIGFGEKIEQVDVDRLRVVLEGRNIINHIDVIDTTPSEFKKRFRVRINPFDVNKISFI